MEGSTLGQDAVLLILGFVLTTVLGGVLGTYFQRRTWNHQFAMSQYQAERSSALAALEEICSILDKRRYRMLLLSWYLADDDEPEIRRRLGAYRAVLTEWNDGLNRRLSVVATHFGAGLKADLETLYEQYRETGRALEEAARNRSAGRPFPLEDVQESLERLNYANYAFGEKGLELIIGGRIGRRMSAGGGPG